MNKQTKLSTMRGLSEDERTAARKTARDNVIAGYGNAPTYEAYQQEQIDTYPAWFTRLTGILLLIGLAASFLMSSFRIFSIGRDTFLHGIPDAGQAVIAGFATVVLAEVTILISLLALTTYARTRTARAALWVTVGLAFTFALVGNWTKADPITPFGYLEAILPPVFTVNFSNILKNRALVSIREKHAADKSYREALAEWQRGTRQPETAPQWSTTYANCLRDALTVKSRRYKSSRETLPTLGAGDWWRLVNRELQADSWYENHDSHTSGEPLPETPFGDERADETPVPFSPIATIQDAPENTKIRQNGNGHIVSERS